MPYRTYKGNNRIRCRFNENRRQNKNSILCGSSCKSLSYGDRLKFKQEWLDEVQKASYRDFTTAFFDGSKDTSNSQNYGSGSYIRTYDIIGNVLSYDENTKLCRVRQKNRFFKNDEIEIIGPNFPTTTTTIKSITSLDGKDMDCSNIPMQEVYVDLGIDVKQDYILRKKVDK